jgi:diguanylate cyclase (GGDEF)-like protein
LSLSVGNWHDLSASQAAKLFHLSTDEIQELARARKILAKSIDRIFSRLCSKLSILPGGAQLLVHHNKHSHRAHGGLEHWLDRALRPWNPIRREPNFKHLAILCAKRNISVSYITAILCCLEEACLETLASEHRDGHLERDAFDTLCKVIRKRLSTEQLGLLSVYGEHHSRRIEKQIHQMEQNIQIRSKRLGSTVSLSQAVAEEIDENQVMRILAQHVMETFNPDHLSINTIEECNLVATPISIVKGQLVDLPDDLHMRALRKDWHLCRAARTGKLYHVDDVRSALVKCPHQAWPQTCGSHCCIPLSNRTQVFGWMHLRRRQVEAFSEEDLEVLGIYGQMVGTALTSLRLLKENRHQATTDPLTGLFNRRYFQSVLNKEDLILSRRGGIISIMMLDLDKFKKVNDQFGHAIGDRVLRSISDLLLEVARKTDEVARIGGDEFVLLLRDCDSHSAARVADKLLKSLQKKRILLDHSRTLDMGVSIGIASSPEHAPTLEETVLLADVALLQAKEQGRNRYTIFGPQANLPQGTVSSP